MSGERAKLKIWGKALKNWFLTKGKIIEDLVFSLADAMWMLSNEILSALPFSTGGLLLFLSPWVFFGVSVAALPLVAVLSSFLAETLYYRYGKEFHRWPQGKEWLTITFKALETGCKYGLILVAWTVGAFVGGMGAGPLGLVATHLLSALGAGIGSALAAYAWVVGKNVFNHFFEVVPSPTFFRYTIKRKLNPGPFPWMDALVKPIYQEAFPAFLAGIAWYGASLIPGAFLAMPVLSEVAHGLIAVAVGCGVAVAAAWGGTFFAPKLVRAVVDVVRMWADIIERKWNATFYPFNIKDFIPVIKGGSTTRSKQVLGKGDGMQDNNIPEKILPNEREETAVDKSVQMEPIPAPDDLLHTPSLSKES